MCGGFACALGRDPQGRGATVLRHYAVQQRVDDNVSAFSADSPAPSVSHMHVAGIDGPAAERPD